MFICIFNEICNEKYNIHYINDKIPKKFANGGLKLLRYIDVIFKFCCTYIKHHSFHYFKLEY